MKLLTQISAICGLVVVLAVSVLVSCTRNLGLPVTATGTAPTATLSNTPTATLPPGSTFTFTNTPTVTDTNTSSSTPNNTATMTATNTLCAGCNTSTSTNTPTVTATSTPTNTPTNTCTNTVTPTATNTMASTPTSNLDFDDFDEAPWTTAYPAPAGGGNGYLGYVDSQQSCMLNSIGENANTAYTHNASAGSIDINVTWSAATGNLLEAVFENGVNYGAAQNVQFSGVNPTSVAVWIYPTAAVNVAKMYIYQGTPQGPCVPASTACPANTWTNIVAPLGSIGASLTSVTGVMIDFTSPATGTIDIYVDDIYFYQ